MKSEKQLTKWLQDLTLLSRKVCHNYLIRNDFDLNMAINNMIMDGVIDFNRKSKVEKTALVEKNQVYELIEFMNQTLAKQEGVNRVVVLATMSSGKSTLINAFLGRRLMPSQNEACTAKIISINNDSTKEYFVDFEDQIVDLKQLQQLNESDSQTQLKFKGPIQMFNDIDNFEIIDTPGPNNSRDASHKKITYDFIKNEEKPLILIMLDGTKLLTDDEADFIDVIAREASGNSSKKIDEDRFIFVVNKSDCFRNDEDDIEKVKRDIRSSLQELGIKNPKIHFISAHNALLSQLSLNNEYMTEDDEDDLYLIKRKLKRNANHFYQYSDLSPSVRKTLENKISKAKEKADWETVVLLTSGVVGLELSVRQYISKYPKTKINKEVIEQISHQALEIVETWNWE